MIVGFISPILANNNTQKTKTIKHQNIKVNITSIKSTDNKTNGSIKIISINGTSPYKAMIYSTNHKTQEYNFDSEIEITNLSSGEYLIVVSDKTNAFVSENITL
jgi:hypothetical protein